MSSGSYATKAGFREDAKPNGVAPCPAARYEDRGPEHRFAGCCRICGRATTHRDETGAVHEQIPGLIA